MLLSPKNAQAQMRAFFGDSNIDILSPQLYTNGEEPENNYNTSQGVAWSDYENVAPEICPAIVKASYYASAVEYFRNDGVTLGGFIQWSQA